MTIPVAAPLDTHEEWRIQIVAYLAGELTPDEIQELSAALRASPELRDEFVALAKQQVLLDEIGETAMAELPARTSAFISNAPTLWTTVRQRARYAVAALIFIGLLAGGIALNGSRSNPLAINADFADTPKTTAAIKPNEILKHGPQTLASGLMQLQLDNGVMLVIEGPARFQVDTNMKVLLNSGKLTAKVSANAHGFMVQTPSAQVVDLGTEFGVEVRADGSTYTAVFMGAVQVYALNASTSPESTITLTREQAANVWEGSAFVTPGEYVPQNFVLDMTQARHPIPLFNTGAQLKAHDPDPHWQIVKEDFNPQFTPQHALVVNYNNDTPNDTPWHAAWISTHGSPTTVPPGNYTFKTVVDMTGFDPATALIHARIGADDGIEDIRINGHSTGQKLPPSRGGYWASDYFVLRGSFQPGLNEIEFVVKNIVIPGRNPVMLRVEWTGTAAQAH